MKKDGDTIELFRVSCVKRRGTGNGTSSTHTIAYLQLVIVWEGIQEQFWGVSSGTHNNTGSVMYDTVSTFHTNTCTNAVLEQSLDCGLDQLNAKLTRSIQAASKGRPATS